MIPLEPQRDLTERRNPIRVKKPVEAVNTELAGLFGWELGNGCGGSRGATGVLPETESVMFW